MSERFKNKVAVVTGGNSGIGLATARAFAREGAKVAITGRSDATLKAAQRELGPDVLVLKADFSQVPVIAKAMDRIKERFGRIDTLFVNAGVGKFVPFEDVTEALFDETMATNLKAAFFTLAKTLSADLLQRGIRVNVVSPGPVATPIIDRMGLPEEATRRLKEQITERVPLKRFG